MEKITQFFTNYRSFYNIFKKLPVIIFFVTVALAILLGFIECVEPFTELGYELEGASLIVFPLIGLVVGVIDAIACAIAVSPIIIIAEASLKKIDESI